MDQISFATLITQFFILNFAKISVFQAVKTGYIRVLTIIDLTDLINISALLPGNVSLLECF